MYVQNVSRIDVVQLTSLLYGKYITDAYFEQKRIYANLFKHQQYQKITMVKYNKTQSTIKKLTSVTCEANDNFLSKITP